MKLGDGFMEEKLVSYFTQEEIDYIYECLVEYSIRNYEKMTQGVKEELQEKYDHARNLSTQTIELSDKELEDFLLNARGKYQENIQTNHAVIELFKHIPIITLIKHMPESISSNEEKIYYLLDFMTRYINYSECYFNHCILTPPTKGIEFDFKNTVPVEHDVNSILVQGQGLCEDICNTMALLGKKFDIPIGTMILEYQNRLHTINTLVLDDNKISLIDTTRMIREGKIMDDLCLVDKDTLNKNDEYKWKDNLNEIETVILPKTNIKTDYNMTNIIHEIRQYLPKIDYQTQKQKSI